MANYMLQIVFLLHFRLITSSDHPNIIIILADDMGWNDVSFHGSDQIPTPNIDALAYNGIILNSHYSPALCTPSRTALLTGKYPTTIGMQHNVILADEPWGVPLEETLFPQHLKRHGYSTHAIGKWHLGFFQEAYTPTRRGFDTFFGYYNGYQDYYDHTVIDSYVKTKTSPKGYDMRRNLELDYDAFGKYATDCFTEEAVEIINSRKNTTAPFFLYLAHLAPHTGNVDDPFQAPKETIEKFEHIKDEERRIYAAMVSRLDDSVGRVISALKDSGNLENSIIIFMADNGAPTFGIHSNRGSNFPLRGMKETPWEGGVRTTAILWSPLLKEKRRVSNQLMHVSDWMPTLFSAAGLNLSELGDIDGMNLWNALSNNWPSPRNEVFNNYNEVDNYSSFRLQQWKYVSGSTAEINADRWYGESGYDTPSPEFNISDLLDSETNKILTKYSRNQKTDEALTIGEIISLRTSATVTCSSRRIVIEIILRSVQNNTDLSIPHEELQAMANMLSNPDDCLENITACDPFQDACIFNLEFDPCEKVNLARFFPSITMKIEKRLDALKKSVVKPINKPSDPLADPNYHNQTWTSWRGKDDRFTDGDVSQVENFSYKFLTEQILGIVPIMTNHVCDTLHLIFDVLSVLVIVWMCIGLGNSIKIRMVGL